MQISQTLNKTGKTLWAAAAGRLTVLPCGTHGVKAGGPLKEQLAVKQNILLNTAIGLATSTPRPHCSGCSTSLLLADRSGGTASTSQGP